MCVRVCRRRGPALRQLIGRSVSVVLLRLRVCPGAPAAPGGLCPQVGCDVACVHRDVTSDDKHNRNVLLSMLKLVMVYNNNKKKTSFEHLLSSYCHLDKILFFSS